MKLPPVFIPPFVERSFGIPPAKIPPRLWPPTDTGGAGDGVAEDAEPTFPALFARALVPGLGGLKPAFGTGGAPPTAAGTGFVGTIYQPEMSIFPIPTIGALRSLVWAFFNGLPF
jgi:hypothetical protein